MPVREELTMAARIQLAFEPFFPLDLLVRTPQRLRRRLADGDSFLLEVTSKGIVLYEKRNAARVHKAEGDCAHRSSGGSHSRPS